MLGDGAELPSTMPSAMPAGSVLGGGVHSLREICGGSRRAKANCRTWVFPTRPGARPWPAPTNTALGSCSGACFIDRSAVARRSLESHGFSFKNKLLSLNAAWIELCATLFRRGAVPACRRHGEAAFCRSTIRRLHARLDTPSMLDFRLTPPFGLCPFVYCLGVLYRAIIVNTEW
jgi:hypothetical protein